MDTPDLRDCILALCSGQCKTYPQLIAGLGLLQDAHGVRFTHRQMYLAVDSLIGNGYLVRDKDQHHRPVEVCHRTTPQGAQHLKDRLKKPRKRSSGRP